MKDLDRRTAVALGLATTAATFAPPHAAAQTTYGPNDGREVAPGVRRVDLSRRESMIPAYKTVSMRDMIYQPGAVGTGPSMPNDMVCHCLEGELQVDLGPGMQFTAKKGDVWTCAKGMPESASNKGSTVTIMRVTDLLAG